MTKEYKKQAKKGHSFANKINWGVVTSGVGRPHDVLAISFPGSVLFSKRGGGVSIMKKRKLQKKKLPFHPLFLNQQKVIY